MDVSNSGPRISFIVPCYNVADLVKRCLDSLSRQGLAPHEYEIIAVDDGSTDGTGRLLDDCAFTWRRLRILHQANQGQSVGRNNALTLARGRYVWFVDSDDYLLPRTLLPLLQQAERDNLDILHFQLKKIFPDHEESEGGQPVRLEGILSGRDAIVKGYVPASVCICLYRREFLVERELRFVPRLFHQDVEFNMRAMALARRVAFCDARPYVYDVREGSTLTTRSLERRIKLLTDDLRIVLSFREFMAKLDDAPLCAAIERHCRASLFGLFYGLARNRGSLPSELPVAVLNFARENDLFPLRSPYNSLKHRLAAPWINSRLKRL